MPDRIVEISADGRHLAVERGFMTVSEKGKEIARIPLDDIAAVIGNAHGLTYSNNLMVQLAQRGAVFVLCGPNHCPVAWLWPVDGHHRQSARFDAQIAATLPKSKQIWKQVVKAKIERQAALLAAIGEADAPVKALAAKVRSGDPENLEAQAARRYWSLLFGRAFRRDRDAGDANALLNYAYTIIRSTVARSVIAAGLHPAIGIHHKNAGNPMRLVDDLMEPFRPDADFAVFHLLKSGRDTLSADVKRVLAGLPEMEVATAGGMTALRTAIQNAAISLAQVYEGSRDCLDLPLVQPPLWNAQAIEDSHETIQRS